MKDTNARSLTKAVTWRLVGTLDTILLASLMTSHLKIAVYIGLTELTTKTALFFIHERLWNNLSWGRLATGPTHLRSLTKSVSWRTIGTIDTIVLAYFYSGQFHTAISIGGLELFTKIALFYCHERIWAVIKWGRLATASIGSETNNS